MIVSPGKNTYTKIDTKRTKKKKKKKKKKKRTKIRKNIRTQMSECQNTFNLANFTQKNIHRLFLFLQQIKNQRYLPLFPMH